MTLEHIPVEMNAARVCDAVAKIGYNPAAAIMDIVDNSITAGATRILIDIEQDQSKTYAMGNNVVAYRVLDNGKGMSDKEILSALKLGADANYPDGSLSKFGMGLKSAGLSLGGRINVVSCKDGKMSMLNYVDRDAIEKAGQYIVCRDTDEVLTRTLHAFLANETSGSVIEVSKCHVRKHQSAKRTIDHLVEQLGVVYHHFLTAQDHPLTIEITCTGKECISVPPLDILFTQEAYKGFDPDKYDCRRPCLVLDEKFTISAGAERPPVRLTVVLFPKDSMSKHLDLTPEEREAIKKYSISRKNRGFFIHRNGRLIRWGDPLGLVNRDKIGFRARLDLQTAHDDDLHVDVSKQRLDIPDEVLKRIENLIRLPLRQASDLFSKCDDYLSFEEGSEFNERNQNLAEEDYDEPDEPTARNTAKNRKQKLTNETEEKKLDYKKEDQPKPKDGDAAEIPIFQKVRYSNGVKSMFLWESGYDPTDGTFVRINGNHMYYSTVLARLEETSGVRQAVEALFWVTAAAENLTRQNLTTVEDETIVEVLTKFKQLMSSNLDSWCLNNQDILNNG